MFEHQMCIEEALREVDMAAATLGHPAYTHLLDPPIQAPTMAVREFAAMDLLPGGMTYIGPGTSKIERIPDATELLELKEHRKDDVRRRAEDAKLNREFETVCLHLLAVAAAIVTTGVLGGPLWWWLG